MSPTVVVVSNENTFTRILAEYLSSKGLRVHVSKSERAVDRNTNYLIVINLNGRWSKKASLADRINKFAPKTVMVNSAADSGFLETQTPVKQIFVDNLFPVYSELAREVYRKAQSQSVSLPVKAWLVITTVDELLAKIAEELFSFAQDKKILFGKLVSYQEIVNIVNPAAQVSVNMNVPHRLPRQDIEVVETNTNLRAMLSAFANAKAEEPRQKKQIRLAKWPVFAVVSAIVLLIVTPYFLLVVSGASSGLAYKALKSGQLGITRKALSLAGFASRASWQILSFSRLPLAGAAGSLVSATGAAGRVLAISDYAHSFTSSVASGEGTESLAQLLHLELTALYNDLSFLESGKDLESLPFVDLTELGNLDELRSHVLAASKLARELPGLLGFDRPKTYMLLLQNNMELRPTGGFIGSFALLTFSKGELIDNTVYDVYSADGQLKGYIEPPGPIEEHLGEASWTLRDSNWDPHFPTSAARAEWFLDKSLDREVDGVIAVNLEVARKALEVLGPVELADFGDTIDSKNMYEKVQFEVEDNFFPGSRKKAHYLAALMNAVLARVRTVGFAQALELVLATVDSLATRDIQVYLDEPLGLAFTEQGWDGGVKNKQCAGNCASVFSGIVEANLGVNKANYYIGRRVSLSAVVGEAAIEYELTLELVNKATSLERIPEQRYKAYVRAMAPGGSVFGGAFESANGSRKYVDVDVEAYEAREEYGVLVEVLPGETKSISYKWSTPGSLDFKKDGELTVHWWKQSGTGEYPIELSVKLPQVSSIKTAPPAALTGRGTYHYNTTLSEDLNAQFIWKAQ